MVYNNFVFFSEPTKPPIELFSCKHFLNSHGRYSNAIANNERPIPIPNAFTSNS